MEATISGTRTVSPTRLKIRQFLGAKNKIGSSVGVTLVRVNDWTASLQRNLSEPADRLHSNHDGRADIVEHVAENLIGHSRSLERRLLSKSLQEALYYCIGFDTNIDYPEFRTRFLRYLTRHDKAAFMRRFLSLYFFNFVWFQTGESFRSLVRSPESFEDSMDEVERICFRVSGSIWKSFQMNRRRLDLSSAEELVRRIDERLRGE